MAIKCSSLSSNLISPRLSLHNNHYNLYLFGRLLMNHSLTNLTWASQSWRHFCSLWSPSGGLAWIGALQYASEYWLLDERWVAAFKPWPLGRVPSHASERCRGPQTALSKQLCQNILCWWRLQSVTSSFLINWWGTAEFVSGVPLLARRWSF